MSRGKSVLLIGLDPALLDFSRPAYAAFPGMTAEKVLAGVQGDQARLRGLGYEAEVCLTDLGETAESVVRAALAARPYACVMIGAGVRVIADHFLLFEQLVNAVHEAAPQARICFNTRPDDTAAAVQRWI